MIYLEHILFILLKDIRLSVLYQFHQYTILLITLLTLTVFILQAKSNKYVEIMDFE